MKTFLYTLDPAKYEYSFPQPMEQIAFFDIETTGLSPNASSLYLIGLMRFDHQKQNWTLQQWFADDYQSEKSILEAFLACLCDISYLFHFNGRTFDIPYILKKCHRHAISLSKHCEELLQDTTGIYSIDLLTRIRSLRHALSLEKCNQTAIEHWLGIQRTDTFSGAELIQVYSAYMQQKILQPENASKLETVLLLHNHDDVDMMRNISSLLTYDEYLSDNKQNRLLSSDTLHSLRVAYTDPSEAALCLSVTLPDTIPKEVTLTARYEGFSTDSLSEHTPSKNFSKETADFPSKISSAVLHFQNHTATFTFPVYHGTLKFFFPNYKDYYYLPEEDTAMHKSVAAFVDSSHRKKATAATCYIKKEGVFLPTLCPVKKRKDTNTPSNLFYANYKDKLSFYELPEDFKQATSFWMEYLRMQLPYFR